MSNSSIIWKSSGTKYTSMSRWVYTFTGNKHISGHEAIGMHHCAGAYWVGLELSEIKSSD